MGDGFLWASVGRLDRQKGYDLLLTAFDAVRRTRPDVRLAIAGDGPEREALTKIVDQLDLADSAFLLGDRHDVPAILAAADAFVLSSRWEGAMRLDEQQAGKTVCSGSRVHSEYSLCSAAIGCVRYARRRLSAPASESPRKRTFPSRTSSAMAPTVSSTGVAGSMRWR